MMKLPPESSSSWGHILFAGYPCSSLQAWLELTALPSDDRAYLSEVAVALRASTDALLKYPISEKMAENCEPVAEEPARRATPQDRTSTSAPAWRSWAARLLGREPC